jgi:phage-related protein
MIKTLKRLPAIFYETASGNKPVRAWLRGLDPDDRHTIGIDLMKVEFGWPIGMPVCRPLSHGLWEVRSSLMSGREARIIFCIHEQRMVMLHSFFKKTQKMPQRDFDLALKRKQEVVR